MGLENGLPDTALWALQLEAENGRLFDREDGWDRARSREHETYLE